MKKENCLLADPNCHCKGSCNICGWDKDVAQERKEQIAKQGLTLCEDGLRRLVIKREDEYA